MAKSTRSSGNTKAQGRAKKADKTDIPTKAKATRARRKEEDVEEQGGEREEADDGIDWSIDLTWALIAAINENEEIKRGLFPPPGSNASTTKGGGKVKADHHFALAKELFGTQDSLYFETFTSAVGIKKEEQKWTRKIKNRLSKLTKLTRKYIDELGETGAGIKSADEIDMSQSNAFTNKWGAIRDTFPFFFAWRDLMGQRPNFTPVGLGNSSTEVDLSVLGEREKDEVVEFANITDMETDTDTDAGVPSRGKKRKASISDDTPKLEGDVKTSISQSSKPVTKKQKGIDALVGVTIEEEKTRQAQCVLAQVQAKVDGQVKLELIKAKRDRERLKEETRRLKVEMEMKRMDLEMKRLEMHTGSSIASPVSQSATRDPWSHTYSLSEAETSFKPSRSSTPFSSSSASLIPTTFDDFPTHNYDAQLPESSDTPHSSH